MPGEIVPDREFYDYDSKYSADSRTELRIPARLSAAETREAQELGVRVFQAVDASGYARVDFLMDRKTGKMYVNEINTIPGFTSISMFPKLWGAAGLDYDDLLSRLVELGLRAAPPAARAAHRLPLIARGGPPAGRRGRGRVADRNRWWPPRSHEVGGGRSAANEVGGGRRAGPGVPRRPRSSLRRPRGRGPGAPSRAGAVASRRSRARLPPGPGPGLDRRAAARVHRARSDAGAGGGPGVGGRGRAPARGPRRRARALRPRRRPAACAAAITSSAPTARRRRARPPRCATDLLAARALDPEDADVLFGLGLYDYYVDVLPRFARLLRFLSRLPGGDRARGLLAIEKAGQASTLHGVEARVQLYEIHAFYEDDPEAARRRHGVAGPSLSGLAAVGAQAGRASPRPAGRLRGERSGGAAAAGRRRGRGAAEAGAARAWRWRGSRSASRSSSTSGPKRRATRCSPSLDGARRSARARRPRASAHRAQPRARRRARGRGRATTARPRPPTAKPQARAGGAGPSAARGARSRGGSAWLSRAARARRGTAEDAAARARELSPPGRASRGGGAARGRARSCARAARRRARPLAWKRRAEDEPPWLVPWSRLLRARQADLEGRAASAPSTYTSRYMRRHCRRVELRERGGGRVAPPRSGRRPPSRRALSRPRARKRTSILDRSWRRVFSMSRAFQQRRPQAKPSLLSGMPRRVLKKNLDKGMGAPYPTPSMSSPLSPTMLIRGSSVHAWTERGDYRNGREEEGRQEGRIEEEEVSAPGTRGGGPITPSTLSS